MLFSKEHKWRPCIVGPPPPLDDDPKNGREHQQANDETGHPVANGAREGLQDVVLTGRPAVAQCTSTAHMATEVHAVSVVAAHRLSAGPGLQVTQLVIVHRVQGRGLWSQYRRGGLGRLGGRRGLVSPPGLQMDT